MRAASPFKMNEQVMVRGNSSTTNRAATTIMSNCDGYSSVVPAAETVYGH